MDTYTIDQPIPASAFQPATWASAMLKEDLRNSPALVLEGDDLREAAVTIEVQSLGTRIPERDAHLRTADFFDVTNYPTITFKTKKVQNDGGHLLLVGDFMMRGVTREIALPLTLSKPVKDSSGKIRIGLEVAAKLNRKDYGIKYNKLLETGVPDVSDEIELEINAEAIRDTLPKDTRAN